MSGTLFTAKDLSTCTSSFQSQLQTVFLQGSSTALFCSSRNWKQYPYQVSEIPIAPQCTSEAPSGKKGRVKLGYGSVKQHTAMFLKPRNINAYPGRWKKKINLVLSIEMSLLYLQISTHFKISIKNYISYFMFCMVSWSSKTKSIYP